MRRTVVRRIRKSHSFLDLEQPPQNSHLRGEFELRQNALMLQRKLQ
jgi:hypothetical protein